MEKSKKLCVHLTTGFMWLRSIQTTEENSEQRALEEAVAYAIKNNLSFSYFEEGSDALKEHVEWIRSSADQTDEEVLEYGSYMYLDLSEYGLPNVWVSMEQTRIDHQKYTDTIEIKGE